MNKAYIVAAKRSAIGTFLGSLTNVPAAELGATVLKAAIAEAGIEPKDINEVIIGNVIGAGLGQNIARHISLDAGILKAGLPTPSTWSADPVWKPSLKRPSAFMQAGATCSWPAAWKTCPLLPTC